MSLRAQDIRVTLNGRAVLRDVSAHFVRGAVTVIIGPNGAGKSTLLACLAGLLPPTGGGAWLEDARVDAMPALERARRIALLPQQGEVHWDVRAREVVALGRWPHHGRRAMGPDDRAAMEAAMTMTDCLSLAERNVRTLSGGERARVMLARALAGRPEWLLADEPLASLDPAHQLAALATFRAVAAEGVGVVLVLHDLTQAARVADHIMVLHEGGVAASGPGAALLDDALLDRVFGIRVSRTSDDNGQPLIIPVSRLSR